MRSFPAVACKFSFYLLSCQRRLIMDLAVLESKHLCKIFRLMTHCTPINSVSISIFSPLYEIVRGMKIPFESSLLCRSCTVKGELSVANFLVNYFSVVHSLTLVAVHPRVVVLQRYLPRIIIVVAELIFAHSTVRLTLQEKKPYIKLHSRSKSASVLTL